MIKFAALPLAAILLAGCAEMHLASYTLKKAFHSEAPYQAPPITGKRKIGQPYEIMGKTYYPKSSSEGYRRKGIASWYGADFHGKKTANGEIYNMHDMTAAHPTLPLPTYVRVTNLDNGKSIIVRVNDRGPFLRGRIIDLSYKAAKKIDMVERGTAPVLLEALPTDGSPLRNRSKIAKIEDNVTNAPRSVQPVPVQPTVTTVPAASEQPYRLTQRIERPAVQEQDLAPEEVVTVGQVNYYIQTGAFSYAENAAAEAGRLRDAFNNVKVVEHVAASGQKFYRVRIGPVADIKAADTVLQKAVGSQWPTARIVLD